MSIRKISLCFILTLLGVMFIAPSASAEEAPAEIKQIVENICEHYSLNADDVDYIYTYGYTNGANRPVVAVYPYYLEPNLRYGSGLYGSDSTLAMNYQFVNGYVYRDMGGSNSFYSDTGTSQLVGTKDGDNTFDVPHDFYGTYDSVSFYAYANYENLTEAQAVSYNKVEAPLANVDLTHIKPVLTGYLESKGWSVTGAYLADSNLSQTKPLNIVTDYNDLPPEYEGLYCLRSSTAGLYKFSVAITPGSDPNDYSDYWDDYLVVVFNTSDLTNVTCHFGCAYPQSAHPLALKIGTANWVTDITTTPMTIFDEVFRGVSIGTAFNESQSTQIRLAVRWRYNNTSAIPRPQISPLYVGFDYSNEVNGTVLDGNGSTEYNDYETNYYTTTYQQAVTGLTGTITGRTSFTGSWTGENADTTIDYDDNMTFDDEAGFGDFFQDIWRVGDGYFTTLLLSVLAVAFAAYLIYGRS